MRAKSNSFARTGPCPQFKPQTLQECDEHTNQLQKSDSLKVTNAVTKEWDQLDTPKNNERTSDRNSQ
jgi:hypothetical protein